MSLDSRPCHAAAIEFVAPDVVFCGVIVFAGGLLGATLVGIYFVVSDMLFGWHTNEVFASQSIINYRNFRAHASRARRHAHDFPDRPARGSQENGGSERSTNPHEPLYEPTDRVLTPHLIEGPITVERR